MRLCYPGIESWFREVMRFPLWLTYFTLGYFVLPTGLSQLPISLAPLQRYQAWVKLALPKALQSYAWDADRPLVIQQREGGRKSYRWHVGRTPNCFPREHRGPVLPWGPVWAILSFTPDCQSSETPHLTGDSTDPMDTGLAVSSGLTAEQRLWNWLLLISKPRSLLAFSFGFFFYSSHKSKEKWWSS